jgi:D-alanyl-D-alanine carboxypeptidase
MLRSARVVGRGPDAGAPVGLGQFGGDAHPCAAAFPFHTIQRETASMTVPSFLSGPIGLELRAARIPGCSVAVSDAAGTLWSGGFGFADLRSGRRADADTVYHLFSGTKLFTATAVLQLVERGALTLEDSVTRHVPEARRLECVTLLHLLSHRSGIRESLKGFLAFTLPPEASCTSTQALARYRLSLSRRPGERVEYRNVNFALLGEIVSRASGSEYRDFVQREILRPLGMHASFSLTDADRPRAATGYLERGDPMRLALPLIFPGRVRRLYGQKIDGFIELAEYDLCTAAAGGLVGSMAEFARFLKMQLAGGEGVLRPDSVQHMQTMVAKGQAGIESRVGVGLAWKHGEVQGRAFLNHEGGGAGFTSELRIYPDAGIGIALGMNGMRAPRTMKCAHRICEILYAARDRLAGEQATREGRAER